MSEVVIRNLSPKASRALRIRALENNRSPEDEARDIIEQLLCPEGRLLVGSVLAALSKADGLSNKDVEALENARDSLNSSNMWFG